MDISGICKIKLFGNDALVVAVWAFDISGENR
jgi:hypothetical protein